MLKEHIEDFVFTEFQEDDFSIILEKTYNREQMVEVLQRFLETLNSDFIVEKRKKSKMVCDFFNDDCIKQNTCLHGCY